MQQQMAIKMLLRIMIMENSYDRILRIQIQENSTRLTMLPGNLFKNMYWLVMERKDIKSFKVIYLGYRNTDDYHFLLYYFYNKHKLILQL